MKRLFTAIDIPLNTAIKGKINTLRNELAGERIKWVEPHQYHITLQFLGSVDASLISPLNESIEKVSSDFKGFSMEVNEFGVFKNFRDPRILWIGFRPCRELDLIKNAIDDAFINFGFEKSDKKFSPHLTIARIKSLREKHKLEVLAGSQDYKVSQKVDVKEIILYESILKPSGPEYLIVKKHALR
jgi:2'-5' RNA ligase